MTDDQNGTPDDLVGRYPHLFREVVWPWGPTRARFVRLDAAPSARLISNVNMVPRARRNFVIIGLAGGAWEMPGGTL